MAREKLLASDLDGTLICPDLGEKNCAEIRAFSSAIAGQEALVLAYVTGRHLELALEGITTYKLPLPEMLVCDVGTSLYVRKGEDWKQDEVYRKRLTQSWKGYRGKDVAQVLKDLRGLIEQEEEKQSDFKQSYYVGLDYQPGALYQHVRDKLKDHGIEANLIYSIDTKRAMALFDVLPPGAAKDSAVFFLAEKLGIAKDDMVYAGDSGNDLAVFLSGVRSIVVGNAPKIFKEEVLAQAKVKALYEQVYFAQEECVGGVLEGCKHFGLFKS